MLWFKEISCGVVSIMALLAWAVQAGEQVLWKGVHLVWLDGLQIEGGCGHSWVVDLLVLDAQVEEGV